MASATAMKKHAGGVAEYRASEGKTVEVSHEVQSIQSTYIIKSDSYQIVSFKVFLFYITKWACHAK